MKSDNTGGDTSGTTVSQYVPAESGECPPGSHIVGFGGTKGTVGPRGARCLSDNPSTTTTTTGTTPTTTTTPTAPTTTTTPTTPTTGQTGPTIPNRNTGGSSSSTLSTTVINPAATITTVSPEVSNCKLDGNANGIQQQFDTAKFSAYGNYPTGQTAYSEGFTAGCTQAGNTQQMCLAFIQLNTGAPSTTQTQSPTTTQPTQAVTPPG